MIEIKPHQEFKYFAGFWIIAWGRTSLCLGYASNRRNVSSRTKLHISRTDSIRSHDAILGQLRKNRVGAKCVDAIIYS